MSKEPNLIIEIENPPQFSDICEKDGFLLDSVWGYDKRIRTYVYTLLKEAQKKLPSGYQFLVYEGYRPMQAQINEWNKFKKEIKEENPHFSEEEILERLECFVANPYTTGSGHQSGGAVDITLAYNGKECDMGTPINSPLEASYTEDTSISKEAQQNRNLLKTTLESVGFINYPHEWWHYSFGDRLWARLTGSEIAIFAKVDI